MYQQVTIYVQVESSINLILNLIDMYIYIIQFTKQQGTLQYLCVNVFQY